MMVWVLSVSFTSRSCCGQNVFISLNITCLGFLDFTRSSSRQNRNPRNISETTFNYQSCVDFSYAPVTEKRKSSDCGTQQRTQKIFMKGVHSVAYGGHFYLVCTVCDVTIWRHVHVSKPTFRRSFLRHYIMYCIFFCTYYPVLCVIALNIYYQRSKFGYRRKIHSTLRHTSP